MFVASAVGGRNLCGFVVVLLACSPALAGEFRQERVPVTDPLSTIEVSITVGAEGEALNEPVDLHLGLGFPLRLFPLGGTERKPGFAAYAQKAAPATLAEGLKPGESATFEFRLEPPATADADALRTTPPLLADLRVRDIQRVGFASPVRSNWVLADYTVKVNGRVFASHKGVQADPTAVRRELEAELGSLASETEYQAREAADLAEIVATGLATEAESARARELQASLEPASKRLTELSLRLNGAMPWFVETHEQFKLPDIRGRMVQSVEVGLVTQEGGETGSENPLYFWVDGRKYLLTSEADPLAGDRQLQTFQISAAELDANPLYRRRIDRIGIGMVGADTQQGKEPNGARLRRVTVTVDGEPIYDSRQVPADRDTLLATRFVPPAHYNNAGEVAVNEEVDGDLTLWRTSNLLPEGAGPLEDDPADTPPEPAVLNDVPQFENPPLIIYLGGEDDDDPSTPRRRKPRKKPGAASVTIPAAAPRSQRRPRPITALPGPQAPVLTSIRINPAVLILRDGDRPTVLWQVAGATGNVSSYRVDVFGVLPHKAVPLINTPLATQLNIRPGSAPAAVGGVRTYQARPPAINVGAIRSQLVGAEESYLYVQAKVTALSANGTALTSAFGSILPLYPAGVPAFPPPFFPGAIALPGGVPSPIAPPSFQLLPANTAPAPWRPSTGIDLNGTSTAWTLLGEQDAAPALTFASYVARPPLAILSAYNGAVRPVVGNGERINIQYEGNIPLPTAIPTPRRSWRVVGHVAFIGGNKPGTAQVQSRATLSVRPASPAPFFTIQTPTPLAYAKYSSGTTPAPALLIDMPLRFDLMASNNTAASNHDASKYAVGPFVPAGPNGFQGIGAAGTGPLVWVTVNLMIAVPTGARGDAIGVFGLRIVPDDF